MPQHCEKFDKGQSRKSKKETKKQYAKASIKNYQKKKKKSNGEGCREWVRLDKYTFITRRGGGSQKQRKKEKKNKKHMYVCM
jgi:hypothetical protein